MTQILDHFNRLRQGHIISALDPLWKSLWLLPQNAGDIFNAVSVANVRQLCESNSVNYMVMVRIIMFKICNEDMPTRHLLNCIRWLVRIVPVGLEMGLENGMFWDPHPVRKTLGSLNVASEDVPDVTVPQLLEKLLLLLSKHGFTDGGSSQVWEPGIGVAAPLTYRPVNVVIDTNRLEVMRCIMVVVSPCLYMKSLAVASDGLRTLLWLVSDSPRVPLLMAVCSLLNSVCRHLDDSHAPQSPSSVIPEVHQLFFVSCIQLLTLLVSYPMPNGGKNQVRRYLAKLSKHRDIQLVVLSLLKIIIQQGVGVVETVMLFYELVLCNNHFQEQIALTYGAELTITLVQMLSKVALKKDSALYMVLRQFLWFLSGRADIVAQTFQPLGPTYESLPQLAKFLPAPLTARDYIVMLLSQTISKHSSDIDLGKILFNFTVMVSPTPVPAPQDAHRRLINPNIDGGLSYGLCAALINVIRLFSLYDQMLNFPIQAVILALIVKAVATTITKNPLPSRMVMLALLRNELVFRQLKKVVGLIRGAAPLQNFGIDLVGMSADFMGKLPRDALLSRSWGGRNELHLMLEVILPVLKREVGPDSTDSYELAVKFESIDLSPVYESHLVGWDLLPNTPTPLIVSQWTPALLGEYLSKLYYQIYHLIGECRRSSASNNLIKGLNDSVSKFTTSWRGLWGASPTEDANEVLELVVEYVSRSTLPTSPWLGTKVAAISVEADAVGFDHIAKRILGIWMGSNDSTLSIEEEMHQRPNYALRNSMSSLHSLNTLNRSRSASTADNS